MAWVKRDDQSWAHPKYLKAGLEARGLDDAACCYSSHYELDGFVPRAALASIAASCDDPMRPVGKLIEAGRWTHDAEKDGWWIHDFLDYNPPAVERREARERERVRKVSARNPSGQTTDSTRNPESVRPESGPLAGAPRPRAPRRPVPVPVPPSQNLCRTPVDEPKPAPADEATPSAVASKHPRAPDALFDAVVAACGIDAGQLTKSARGQVNAAVGQLRAIAADPDEVTRRAVRYGRRWPGVSLTPTALAKHWATLGTDGPEVLNGAHGPPDRLAGLREYHRLAANAKAAGGSPLSVIDMFAAIEETRE